MHDRQNAPLPAGSLDADPVNQFVRWFQEAGQAGIPLPDAMTLATANQQGKPSAALN